jgi:hypothetical protein
MCTVTWLESEEGYEVFCNRDELKTRKPALPPRFAACQGVRYLAPIDADAGGSWFGANEYGVTLCLVNHYPQISSSAAATRIFRSRGLLLTGLMDCGSSAAAVQRLRIEKLEQYRPFLLLAFELHKRFFMIEWNGTAMQTRQLNSGDLPMTSSSFNTAEVVSLRRENFAKLRVENNRAALIDFHRSHVPERGAFSVCMHRNDAETVSFTHLQVTNTTAALRYYPLAPCLKAKPEVLRMPILGEIAPAH